MYKELLQKRIVVRKWKDITTLCYDRLARAMMVYYNMTVWILAGNYISFTIAAGLIRLHMPGVKKSRV